MRLLRVVLCIGAIGCLLVLAGCDSYLEYATRSAKPNINANTVAQYTSMNYEVLGTVRAVAEGTCVLGVYASGKDGEGLLWEQAQMTYQGNFTGIKDIMAWTEYQAVLPPLVCNFKTHYSGTVVRERRATAMPTPLMPSVPAPAPTP